MRVHVHVCVCVCVHVCVLRMTKINSWQLLRISSEDLIHSVATRVSSTTVC